MIDPGEPAEVQIRKQAKIIDALIERASRQHEIGGTAYSLFQSAVALQGKVSEKTRDLERALDTLGQASNELENSEVARAQIQRNLGDALDAMEGGFALFTDNRLQIFNDMFKNLVRDITPHITPGLGLKDYLAAVAESQFVKLGPDTDKLDPTATGADRGEIPAAPFVLALKSDRWFQITYKRTRSDNVVVLQTEITDIVRRNRLEKDRLIDEQEDFLQAAFDHMNQGVCTFSTEGTLLIHNARFGDLLGLPLHLTRPGTAWGQILDFFRKNDVLTMPDRYVFEMVDELRREGHLKERIRHANGTILDLHVHQLPGGGFIVNIMDVTAESQTTEMLENRVRERTSELTKANNRLREQYDQQAKVEEELRLAKEEAEAAVSSKTRFFAAASHDLLQPINAAKLFISNLMEFSRGSDLEEAVHRLDGSFRSIESLLHALLDISRLDSTETKLTISEFSLDEILHSVREDYSALAAEKGLTIEFVPCSGWVRSDPRYLLRSVQNLVVNAIQYTEKGRILVGCRNRGDRIVIEVWDTGIGISKKDQVLIFNEFTRVSSSKSGSGMGLGLSIVERACRHLGHKVSVRSKPGIGSVFSIELPRVAAGRDRAREVERLPAPEAEMDLIVVLIENDPDVLFATMQRLETWGASVLCAESTDSALEMVAELGMAPDLILADYQLNGDDNGIRSIIALREQTGVDLPAIMVTANRDESLLQEGIENGFSVLTKPVQLSRLRSLIDWKTRRATAATDQSIR